MEAYPQLTREPEGSERSDAGCPNAMGLRRCTRAGVVLRKLGGLLALWLLLLLLARG